jgi:hypothetical protein
MSRFPFGIPGVKVAEEKKHETGTSPATKSTAASKNEQTVRYEQKLAEYEGVLEKYLSCIDNYSERLEELSRKPAEKSENQLSLIQAAVDLTYIKEQGKEIRGLVEELRDSSDSRNLEQFNKILAQGNKAAEQQESLLTTLIDTNYKLEGLDKNVINRFTDIQVELQKQTLFQYKQNQMELQTRLENLTKAVKRNKLLLWLVFLFQFLGLGAMAFIILYLLEIISF